mmetsp:Transcript_88338/g.184604  ORF Transcript_88338/g.184604 Transcript_88338/m.184604 type:complete len:282 (+) Transcript_88338:1385-2230(+)
MSLSCPNLLLQNQAIVAGAAIPTASHFHLRGAGLEVPLLELGQVSTIGIGHGGSEVVASHGGPVVPLEVEVQALFEAIHAQQSLVHSDNLRTLAIDRGSVEVVHGDVAFGSDGVGHGTAILRELSCPKNSNLFNSLHGLASHISRELLITEDSQTFLQCQLKPISASHTVACPIVEILMPNHTFNTLEIRVGRCVRPGQDQGRIEDVQSFVLHGPHVEVAHSNDVILIEVVLQPIRLLVPAHSIFQRFHCVVQLVHRLRFGKETQGDRTSGGSFEGASDGL